MGWPGVSVLEKVRPATSLGRPVGGYGPPPTPRGFAEWLASRPFLVATAPSRTQVGGLEAWQVRVRLSAEAGSGKAICLTQFPCRPVTVSDVAVTTARGSGGFSAIWGDMVADYTFVSLDSGTAAVCSWAWGNDSAMLERNRAAVDGITWPDE